MDLRTPSQVVADDQAHVWHPYAPTPAPMDPIVVDSTSGVYLHTADGRTLIDGMSSWWAACHGHGHPALKQAAHEQIDSMSHVMFGGLTHKPATRLANQLLDLTSSHSNGAADGLSKVFFSDSGSVSVEVAIKMALQYQRGQGHPERKKLLTWRSGYHGDTFGPMSVCDPDGGMHSLWVGTLSQQKFAPPPPVLGSSPEDIAAYLETFESLVDSSVAAVIIEPVVQGAGGMRFHDPAVVQGVERICRRHGLLLIADEIATAFGRTGQMFCTLDNGINPDILCVGKALTGGFMSLAATLTTDNVAQSIQNPEGGGALMHGPTFMGNPLACAVASAAVELAASEYWVEPVHNIEAWLRSGLEPLAAHPAVADVRVRGAIGVVELRNDVAMREATDAATALGVWLRPFGKLIYTMPPFVCTEEEVQRITTAIGAAVDATSQQSKD
mgnify:FL=1